MKPVELYRQLVRLYPSHEVEAICLVDVGCKKNGYCHDAQACPVLDFDEIKNDFYKGVATPSSVDAVCIGRLNKYFCFVELKGWKKYIEHKDKQKNSVEQTVSGYNLVGKLRDSQELCGKIMDDSTLFLDMPVVFLLVTDIDVKTRGIEAFAEMMGVLGGVSSDIYSQCISESNKILASEIPIEHDYIYCKDFDKVMVTL